MVLEGLGLQNRKTLNALTGHAALALRIKGGERADVEQIGV
jgi:hypothetical protein